MFQDNKTPDSRPTPEQVQWLLVLLAIAGFIILGGLNVWLATQSGTQPVTVKQAVINLLSDSTAGIVGALFSYLFVYFVFIRKGVSVSINPNQLENIKQNLQKDITLTSGEMVRGLIENMQRIGDSESKVVYSFRTPRRSQEKLLSGL
ncbi:MAG: hypothetical protein HC929_06535 [Leptolyngbyaceae cyanobacterium SM2_5_2]|nr:hypothetical protein [Leptolyngbyaceae cyanobacterium SM2_5_2]